MSSVINCKSCGAVNNLPEGKRSMYCAFCGNLIEKISASNPVQNNPLNTKPIITQRKVNIISSRKDGDILFGAKKLYRVNDGWMVDSYGMTEFVADKFEQEEEIIDKGGELSLKNRNIKTLSEIICWFSDNELASIRKLDLSGNNIAELVGIEKFQNLREFNLSGNPVSDLPDKNVINSIQTVIMVDTPYTTILQDLSENCPINVTLTQPDTCKNCTNLITKFQNVNSNGLCNECVNLFEEEKFAKEVYENILKGPNPFAPTTPSLFKRWDFTLLMFGVIFFVIYLLFKHFASNNS